MAGKWMWVCYVALAIAILLGAPLAAVQAQGGGNVTCGVEVTGTIDNTTQVQDWTLMLKRQETVTITMLATGGDLDPYLRLLGSDGTLLAENDDASDPSMGYNAQLIQTLSGGRYTIRATRFAEVDGMTSGPYRLSVVCGAVIPPTPTVAATTTTSGVLFADDFSSDTGNWWVGQDENGTVTIAGGEIRIRNYTSAQYTAHSEASQNLSDFIWTVDSRLVGGALDNWHYFSFRYVDGGNRYRVGYSADGWYMGEVVRNGEQVEEMAAPTQTSAIRQGVGVTNNVRIEAIGNQVRFYVNDTLLIDYVVSPANAIPSGDIGLAVASMSGADYSEVAFDNVLVVGPGGAVGNVLFADDFSVDRGEWWLNSDSYGDVYLRNGELVIRDVYDDTALYSGPAPIFDDFVMEVDSRLVSGTINNWHFFLVRLNDNGDCYRVGYSADGYYIGTEFYGGGRQEWVQPTTSNAINQGVGATNHVRIEVQGARVRFYVNGVLLLDQVASHRLPAGYIALSADALEAPETVIAFDNLVITAP